MKNFKGCDFLMFIDLADEIINIINENNSIKCWIKEGDTISTMEVIYD